MRLAGELVRMNGDSEHSAAGRKFVSVRRALLDRILDDGEAQMSTRLATMASLLSAAFLPTAALAQALDYGALEQLFGEPVTSSATGTPQRATEVPADMEIVTAEEIRRSGAYDIPGVLRHVLGVDVMQWGNDNVDVGMRGYDQVFSSRVLVLSLPRSAWNRPGWKTALPPSPRSNAAGIWANPTTSSFSIR